MENQIEAAPPFEAEALPSMCEVRFDCNVKMFEMGVRHTKGGFMGMHEKALPPQWFKSHQKITLDAIRNCDEYTLGKRLKEMLHQLDEHIKRYEAKH